MKRVSPDRVVTNSKLHTILWWFCEFVSVATTQHAKGLGELPVKNVQRREWTQVTSD